MGFDEKRGDSINVVNTSFTQPETAAAQSTCRCGRTPTTSRPRRKSARTLAFALLAAYLLFGVLRPAIRRVVAAGRAGGPAGTGRRAETAIVAAPALGYPEHLQRARQLARDDPKAIAGLVRNWVAANE